MQFSTGGLGPGHRRGGRATFQTHPSRSEPVSKRLRLTRNRDANLQMTEATPIEERFASLMRAAQEGDGEAYTTLMQELAGRLRQIVRRRRPFLERADIEDLVQDTLLSVHAVRATWDPGRPFVPWLLAIARNRLADGARRYARTGVHEVAMDDLDVTFLQDRANTSSAGYGDPEALARAVADLPPGQRTAIELLKLREMSLKEAAATSGTSVGALKVATHRAMETLRRTLKRDDDQGH